MTTITRQLNTVIDHPKFEKRTFWVLVSTLGLLIVFYGYFLGMTIVSAIEQHKIESDIKEISSIISQNESQYLILSSQINMETAFAKGFSESKKTHYVVRDSNVKAFAFAR